MNRYTFFDTYMYDVPEAFSRPESWIARAQTERGDRRTTNISLYIRETSIENSGNCFCHGAIGSKKGHDMNWRVLRNSRYIDRDATKN